MKPFRYFAALFCALTAGVQADVSTSPNYAITISSMDGGGLRSSSSSYTQHLSITPVSGPSTAPSLLMHFGFIAELNAPPIAVDDLRSHPQGGAVDILAAALFANDTDPDGDPISLAGVDPLSAGGGSLTIVNGATIRYIPKSGFTGSDTFRYTIRDANGETAAATVTVATAPPVENQPINSIIFTTQSDGRLLLRFRQQPGWSEYKIEYTNDLKNREWTLLQAFQVGADGIAEFLIDAPQAPATFFRGLVR